MRISDWSSDVCSSDLLIATCGDSSWRRAQRKRVGLLVEARAAVQCKAGDTPEPAPQLVEPLLGVLKAQFEAAVNENGSASCRARVCQYVYIYVVAVSSGKKNR